jgi:hypothetical protein
MTDRTRERRRLLAARERIARRRSWWTVQRDRASDRVDALTAELAALEAETAEAER